MKGDVDHIKKYADSIAAFAESWYNQTLPALSGNTQVSARIDGWDVDVEETTRVSDLPKVLTAVRASLDGLSARLSAPKFSVSITPAWTDYLDESVAHSCDYTNMQNYDGGSDTLPDAYIEAVPGITAESNLAWGISSEMPWKNTETAIDFDDMKTKAQMAADGKFAGIYT